MRKFLPYILILIVLVGIFGPTSKSYALPICNFQDGKLTNGPIGTGCEMEPLTSSMSAERVALNKSNPVGGGECTLMSNWDMCILNGLIRVAFILMGIMALLLWLAGTLLDFVLNFTIVNMRLHIKDLTGINIAWKLIRDLMNISFIFLLVYEGIKIIIGQSDLGKVKKWISMVILASLLINFSLFFTKVLIDASNIVTIGFYNSMIDSSVAGNAQNTGVAKKSGLSVAFMSMLGASDFYSMDTFGDLSQMKQASGGGSNLLVIGLLGSVVFLIISFVFLAVACLFVVRYITLVILLMLSPVAYMGMALPFMKKYSDDWWNSLNGQLLFAPIYMIMTSIILVLMSSDNFITKTGNWSDLITNGSGAAPTATVGGDASISILFNFVVVIGLLIASLVIAKSTSTQGSKFIGQATGKVTAFAGGAVMGGTAWASRKSLGYMGNKVAGDATLQEDAIKKTGFGGAWARTKLYTARTARDASFDVRNASVPTNVIGDAISGTVGRTSVGKSLGLDNTKIPSVAVGAPMANLAGLGKGGEKSYATERAASDKERQDREAANKNELAMAQAKKDVLNGKNAAIGTPEYDAMEQALAKLSDKQTEALVASNRDLLTSQNFANAISVKQLEALNKSDQLSENEKGTLKNARFAEINNGMSALKIPAATRTNIQAAAVAALPNEIRNNLADSELEMIDPTYLKSQDFVSALRSTQLETIIKSNKFTATQKNDLKTQRFAALNDPNNLAALAVLPATRTPTQVAQAGVISRGIKNLSDAELDMIDPTLLATPDFVAQLKPGQVETIGKSNKLTVAQKDAFKTARMSPLVNALNSNNWAVAQSIIRKTDTKTLVGYMNEVGRPGINIALDPGILPIYNPKILARMAGQDNMTPQNIQDLRSALLTAGSAATISWLKDKDKGGIEFS